MKKYLSLFLVTIFILSLTACKKNGNNDSVYDNTTSGFIDLDIAPENQDENQNNESNNTDSSNEEDEKDSKDDKDKDSDSKKEDKENHSDSQNNLSNNQNGNNQNGSSNKNPSNINQNDNNNQNGNSNNSNTNNPSNENDKNYKEIKCRVVDEWKSVELVSNNNVLYLKVNIPSDWNVTENGIIKIKNTQIGQITTKLTENFTNIYEEIKSENTLLSDFTASSSVREYTANKETKYKRIIKISKLVSSGSLLNLFISSDYSQLDDDATEKILNSILNNGEYKPNEKIPSVREIALEAGVNPNTVQKALTILTEQGLLYPMRGFGMFVSDNFERATNKVYEMRHQRTVEYIEEMKNLGLSLEEIKTYIKEWDR